ncbi:unnamed protein product [Alternaria alternata]
MALLTLLLSWLFVTLASACMFPFNNPRHTNSSLVEEYIADLQTKGGNGWTSPIGPSNPVVTAWPKNSASGKVTYIYYCFDSHASYSALKDGYTEARDTIAAHPEWGFTINQACESRYLGTSKKELNFWQAAEYALHTVDESHSYGRLIDHNSIMMYSSWANAADLMHGLANLPLVRWKNGPPSNGHAPDHSNAETVQWPTGISDGDKEAIQKLYPWEG